MSLSKELMPKAKIAIDWFKSLSSEKQTGIVVDYFKDATKLSKDEAEKFNQIVSEIKRSLQSNSKSEITKKLVDLGIDDTLSTLIVEKIGKNQPTLISSVQALSQISDQAFERLISELMQTFWLDWDHYDQAKVADKTGTNMVLVQSAVILLRDGFIWNNMYGEMTMDSFVRILSNEYGYSQRKTDVIARSFEKHDVDIRFANMFRKIRDLEDELKKANQTLAELQQLLKGDPKKSYIA